MLAHARCVATPAELPALLVRAPEGLSAVLRRQLPRGDSSDRIEPVFGGCLLGAGRGDACGGKPVADGSPVNDKRLFRRAMWPK